MGTFSIGMIFVLLLALVFVVLRNSYMALIKKIFLGFVSLGMLVIMAFYTYNNQSSNENIAIIQQAFLENKTLDCDGFLVNQKEFIFVSQTYMFVGKAQTPMSNIAVAIDNCKILEQDPQSEQAIDGHILLEGIQKD